MKITKISLATIVALGAFSSVASATPLEDAIKNVDFTGYARYRYTLNKSDKKDAAGKTADATGSHAFRLQTNFKAAFDDNFFGVLKARYNTSDKSLTKADYIAAQAPFNVREIYLGYKVGNTTATFGKQAVGTIFTDDAIATGLKVVNTDIDGLTLAAAAFDSLDASGNSDGGLYGLAKGDAANNVPAVDAGNLFAVGAVGSFDPISFQLWYASLTKVVNVVAGEVEGSFEVADDTNVGFKVQLATSIANSTLKDETKTYDNGNFYAAELNSSFYGVDVAAGLFGFKTKDDKVTSFSLEDQGDFINPGEQISDVYDYTFAKGKANLIYVTAAYGFDKYSVGLDWVNGKGKAVKDAKEDKVNEIVARAGYKYNDKIKFSGYFSNLSTKAGDADSVSNNKVRFEAKYSF